MDTVDYLLYVNKYSNRSFNAVQTQYPIMPWVGRCIFNKSKFDSYEDSKFDIEHQELIKIRNLTLHTGALSKIKRDNAKKTINDPIEEFEVTTYGDEPYNLKFGYSNSLSVLAYLVRVEPYTSIFIHHNGKLDSSNRMLSDVEEAWDKVCKLTQCNNELTPEWFYLPRIFQNRNWIDFGLKDNNQNVCDVIIPDKFKSHFYLYCMHLRKCLRDSTYSKNLSYWIDLIFGSKQQKKNHLNVFFKYATPSASSSNIQQIVDRENLKSASDFFQLPIKIFTKDHKQRESEYCKEIKEENKLTDENEDNYRKYADKMKKFTYIQLCGIEAK